MSVNNVQASTDRKISTRQVTEYKVSVRNSIYTDRANVDRSPGSTIQPLPRWLHHAGPKLYFYDSLEEISFTTTELDPLRTHCCTRLSRDGAIGPASRRHGGLTTISWPGTTTGSSAGVKTLKQPFDVLRLPLLWLARERCRHISGAGKAGEGRREGSTLPSVEWLNGTLFSR